MRILLAIKKFIQEFPGHFLATCLTLLILTGVSAHAMTSYDVTNEVQMNLDVSITSTQTTGIIIAAPQLNAADHTFATTTGGILRIRWGVYREDILYTSASVNATTKKVTLTGVIRNICPQYTRTYVSCGDGRAWGKGAIVELNQDARLFNLKANIDRLNRIVNSGSIVCSSTSQPCIGVGNYTTTQRDAFTWNTGSTIIRNTTVGALQWWDGSTWLSIATSTGSFVNASESVAGKVQIATRKAQSGSTILGSTGAPNVVGTQYLTETGSSATQYGKIPFLGRAGTLTGSVMCTGNRMVNSGRSYCSGTGAWIPAITTIAYCDKTVYLNTASSTSIGKSSTAENTFDTHTYTIPANSLISGVMYEYVLTGTGTWGAGNLFIGTKLGNTTILRGTILPNSSQSWTLRGQIYGTTTAGPAARLRGGQLFSWGETSTGDKTASYGSGNIIAATDGALTLQWSEKIDSSNASNSFTIISSQVRVTSTSCTQ